MTNELTGSGMERLTQNPERQIGKVSSKKDFSDAVSDFPTKSSNEIDNNELKEPLDNVENKGLSEGEKQQIKDESGWSEEVVNQIESKEEYEIYKDAGLQEAEINGRKCLERTDIDWDQKDSQGITNKQRCEEGRAPINKDGEKIELHHIGQKNDGALAELTMYEHQGGGNYSVLHDPKKESEINRPKFDVERPKHWKERAKNRS